MGGQDEVWLMTVAAVSETLEVDNTCGFHTGTHHVGKSTGGGYFSLEIMVGM